MTQSFKKTPTCGRFERDLYHYQAGELSAGEGRVLADHAESCPGCARVLEIEGAFLRGLKQRLGRAEPPPELRLRVCEALDRQPAPPRVGGWLRAPWLVPAAAALLLAVVMTPQMTRPDGVVHVEREVTVVDIDCETAGRSVQDQRACTHPHHLNALRVGSDRYWNVSLDGDLGRRLAADRDMRGHRLSVVGDLYTHSRTLRLASFTVDDLEHGLSASIVSTPPEIPSGPLPGL
jgi:hypothetical protein